MKNLNPLLLQEISNRTLLKKRKLYSPEQWAKMMAKLQKVGKGKEEVTDKILKRAGVNLLPRGGLHTADEYGKRMIAGQTKRAQKLGKKHGHTVFVFDDMFDGETIFEPARRRVTIDYPNPEWAIPDRKTLASNLKSDLSQVSRKVARKRLRNLKNASNQLTRADILAHEVDELQAGLSMADRFNVTPVTVGHAFGSSRNKATLGLQSPRSTHFPGVLEREAKRAHKLTTLYGRDSFYMHPRDAEQYARNKKRFLLKNKKAQAFLKNNEQQ